MGLFLLYLDTAAQNYLNQPMTVERKLARQKKDVKTQEGFVSTMG